MPAQSTLDRLRKATLDLIEVVRRFANSSANRRELEEAIESASDSVTPAIGRPKST